MNVPGATDVGRRSFEELAVPAWRDWSVCFGYWDWVGRAGGWAAPDLSGVVAAESVQVPPVQCGRSIPLALFGRYGLLLSGGLLLGIAASAGLPVLLGAGGAAGLARDGLLAAVRALVDLLGSAAFPLDEEALGSGFSARRTPGGLALSLLCGLSLCS